MKQFLLEVSLARAPRCRDWGKTNRYVIFIRKLLWFSSWNEKKMLKLAFALWEISINFSQYVLQKNSIGVVAAKAKLSKQGFQLSATATLETFLFQWIRNENIVSDNKIENCGVVVRSFWSRDVVYYEYCFACRLSNDFNIHTKVTVQKNIFLFLSCKSLWLTVESKVNKKNKLYFTNNLPTYLGSLFYLKNSTGTLSGILFHLIQFFRHSVNIQKELVPLELFSQTSDCIQLFSVLNIYTRFLRWKK